MFVQNQHVLNCKNVTKSKNKYYMNDVYFPLMFRCEACSIYILTKPMQLS